MKCEIISSTYVTDRVYHTSRQSDRCNWLHSCMHWKQFRHVVCPKRPLQAACIAPLSWLGGSKLTEELKLTNVLDELFVVQNTKSLSHNAYTACRRPCQHRGDWLLTARNQRCAERHCSDACRLCCIRHCALLPCGSHCSMTRTGDVTEHCCFSGKQPAYNVSTNNVCSQCQRTQSLDHWSTLRSKAWCDVIWTPRGWCSNCSRFTSQCVSRLSIYAVSCSSVLHDTSWHAS